MPEQVFSAYTVREWGLCRMRFEVTMQYGEETQDPRFLGEVLSILSSSISFKEVRVDSIVKHGTWFKKKLAELKQFQGRDERVIPKTSQKAIRHRWLFDINSYTKMLKFILICDIFAGILEWREKVRNKLI